MIEIETDVNYFLGKEFPRQKYPALKTCQAMGFMKKKLSA
jgi:hypothetical protein